MCWPRGMGVLGVVVAASGEEMNLSEEGLPDGSPWRASAGLLHQQQDCFTSNAGGLTLSHHFAMRGDDVGKEDWTPLARKRSPISAKTRTGFLGRSYAILQFV